MKSFYEPYVLRGDLVTADDRLRRMARKVPADARRLLDIGCGRGRNLLAFAKVATSAKLHGVDIADTAIDSIRALGFEGEACDASQHIPYPNEFFDVVTCGEVIEHVVDPDKLLTEIRRVLAPGGLLILTTPNLAYLPNRLLLLLGIQPLFTETSLRRNLGRMTSLLGQGNPTQGHLKIFTLAALRELLAQNGFECQSIEGYRFIQRGIAAFVDALIRVKTSFAAGFILCARRARELPGAFAADQRG